MKAGVAAKTRVAETRRAADRATIFFRFFHFSSILFLVSSANQLKSQYTRPSRLSTKKV
jgi:hypothetical protein